MYHSRDMVESLAVCLSLSAYMPTLRNATLCTKSPVLLIQIPIYVRLVLVGLGVSRLVGGTVNGHELDDDDEELCVGRLILQRVSERVRAG
jgi:hypothetical protein